jgi:hypothetical protein
MFVNNPVKQLTGVDWIERSLIGTGASLSWLVCLRPSCTAAYPLRRRAREEQLVEIEEKI